jgi:hypothetical protein
MAVLSVLHSSFDSQTFTLVVRESVVSPSANWFAPLFIFARLSTGLLLSSSSSELSHDGEYLIPIVELDVVN